MLKLDLFPTMHKADGIECVCKVDKYRSLLIIPQTWSKSSRISPSNNSTPEQSHQHSKLLEQYIRDSAILRAFVTHTVSTYYQKVQI